MKSGFKDPTAIKKQEPGDRTESGNKRTWNYEAPQYDERSSCFVNAGTHYGVCHRQPVGSETYKSSSTIPFGRVSTMRIDEAG